MHPLVNRLAVAIVAALAIVPACSAAPPRCESAARDPSAQPLLWRVDRPGNQPAWLFGTVHDTGADDVPAAAWEALAAARVVVSELGDEPPDRTALAALARLPYGQVLDAKIPADDWWDLVTLLSGVMREDDLRRARPWFALVTLRGHIAKSPKPSMDDALAARAREKEIAVERLETWAEQLAALDASVTADDLVRMIRARHTLACEIAALRSAYRTSDLPALLQMLVAPVQNPALLDARNRKWLPQIERYLSAGPDGSAGRPAFIAVGLGHLLGEQGLLVALERAGYSVERSPAR